ncbi:MAG: MFS transporter, partial [Thermodesulfobacteriota bacterium]
LGLLALAAFGLFVAVERRVTGPLLPLVLFSRRYYSMAVASAVISFVVLFSVFLLTPFYLQRVLGLSASRTGLVMMTVPVVAMLVAPSAGWLSDRIGSRHLATGGLLLSVIGLAGLARLSLAGGVWGVVWGLAFLGAGQAMFLSPNSASVITRIEPRYVGISAGLLATARNMGMALGVASSGAAFAILFARATGGLDLRDYIPSHAAAFLAAMHGTYLVIILVGLVGVYLSWQRGEDRGRS